MITRKTRVRAAAVATAGLAAVGGPALAQEDVTPFLVIERSSLSDMIVSEKDRAFADAIGMVPARLHELSREVPEFPDEAHALIDLGSTILSKPGRIAVTYNKRDQSGGLFGYGVYLSVQTGDRATAREMHRTIADMLGETEFGEQVRPSDRFEGLDSIQLPFAQLNYGAHRGAGGWSYDVIFGSISDVEDGFDALPAPAFEDFRPVLRGAMDFSALNPASEMAQAMAGDEEMVGYLIELFNSMGLVGEDAIKLDFQFGYGDEQALAHFALRGVKPFAHRLGLPEGELTRADLRVVPRDAVLAGIAKADLSQIEDLLDMLGEQGVPVADGLEEFEEMTGVDLRRDILRTLGGTVAFYMSDSTGGGGLMSSVAMITFKNRDRFLEAHTKLVGFAHQMIEQEAPEEFARYFRIESWEHDGLSLMSIRFKGLPIPLEITYAATEDWLVAGLTPQAVIGAIHQAQGRGDEGIASHPDVREAVGGRAISSLSFMDTERLASDGYAIVSMLGSAVANGVRSPWSDREPGLLVPSYRELMSDVAAGVEFGYWQGEDFIVESRSDESLLVQAAGLGGVLKKFAVPLLAGVALPALGEARNTAREIQMERFGGRRSLLDVRPELAGRMLGSLLHIDPIERAILLTVAAPEFEAIQRRVD